MSTSFRGRTGKLVWVSAMASLVAGFLFATNRIKKEVAMTNIDEAKFKELVDKGLISVDPPDTWLPIQTKDKVWKNYYAGRQNHTLHLSGGWMINETTGELRQVQQKSSYANDEFEVLLERAKAVIKETGRSYLQGPMKISYAQQAKILDELERRGEIGPAHGSNPRDIYF